MPVQLYTRTDTWHDKYRSAPKIKNIRSEMETANAAKGTEAGSEVEYAHSKDKKTHPKAAAYRSQNMPSKEALPEGNKEQNKKNNTTRQQRQGPTSMSVVE